MSAPRSLHASRPLLPIDRFTTVGNDAKAEDVNRAVQNESFRSLYDNISPGCFSVGVPEGSLDNCTNNSENMDPLAQEVSHFSGFGSEKVSKE